MKKIAIVSLFALLLCSASLAVPHEINFQGFLKDSADNPVTGNLTMTFKMYNGSDGGSPFWTETHSGVSVEAGLYNVRLGSEGVSINPASFEGGTKYLGVTVGTDSEMTPRVPIVSVPYAFRAEKADAADDFTADSIKLSSTTAPPSSAAGQIYFDSTTNRLMYSDGTQWIQIDPAYTSKPIKVAYVASSGQSFSAPADKDIIIVGISGRFDSTSGSIAPVLFEITIGNYITLLEYTDLIVVGYHSLNRSFPIPIKVPKGSSVTVTATQKVPENYPTNLALKNVYLYDVAVYYIELPL